MSHWSNQQLTDRRALSAEWEYRKEDWLPESEIKGFLRMQGHDGWQNFSAQRLAYRSLTS